jgi:hypothetical protein
MSERNRSRTISRSRAVVFRVFFSNAHVHRVGKRRNVEDAMRALDVEPNLPDTRADVRHRLPVVRVETLLDAPKLKAGKAAHGNWKAADI